MSKTKPSLGKGLDSLLGKAPEFINNSNTELLALSVADVQPSKLQPRKTFDDETIKELANSIKLHGLLQPIVVRKQGEKYIIIAGERRWRAVQMAKLSSIKAIVKDISINESLESAIVENIQRENLNPIDEGEAYLSLHNEFKYTQIELAGKFSKSRSYIANMIRIAKLPKHIKETVIEKNISAGHARAIAAVNDKDALLQKILMDNLSVRDAEIAVANLKAHNYDNKTVENSDISQDFQHKLQDFLGVPVTVHLKRSGGKISIHFKSFEELDDVVDTIRIGSKEKISPSYA
jgi:ParB family chromosome partitioning protein